MDSPEEPVQRVQGRPRPFAFEHGDLLSEGENFEGGVAATAEEHADGGQDGEDEFGHGLTLVTRTNVARTNVLKSLACGRELVVRASTSRRGAFAERWVRSVKSECLSKLILFGEGSLRRVVTEYLEHYHQERNHQGKANLLLFPASSRRGTPERAAIGCRERLGGLLKYYSRAA